jgi:cyclopropane-fatty-acyl-phospholipid synthase
MIRWLCDPVEVLEAPAVRGNAGLAALCGLLTRQRRTPLIGGLTVLFEGLALQFGRSDETSARWLERVHADPVPWAPAGDAKPPTPRDCGLDPALPDLGLTIERTLRHPQAAERDRRPGEWKHPVIKVHAPQFFLSIVTRRNLGLGEAFLAGEFEMLRGSVHHLVSFFLVNRVDRALKLPAVEQARLLWEFTKWRASRSHNEDIAAHYDTGDNIMVPMLGATGCYTCGYMEREGEDLDRMQLNKINLVFSKLRLKPGMRVLDPGCGNGGMLVHAALSWGCHGEGFTNSFNMASLANRNAASNGVADRVRVHNADFDILASYPDEHFDAIFGIGVWEHVPFADYGKVMRELHRVLKPEGRMLLQAMGSFEREHARDAYIQKYVFRDSNQMRLYLALDAARQNDLYVADIENIGRHYYWTVWYWRRNLLAAYESDPTITERDFRVMFYFLECGMAESRFGDGSVYQVLLCKDSRTYLQTWRVDGRIHEAGHGAVQHEPLLMKPCNLNEHLHNDAAAPGKLEQPVYRKNSSWQRLRQWLVSVREVRHE